MDMDWGLGGLEIDAGALDGVERSGIKACPNKEPVTQPRQSDLDLDDGFGFTFDQGLEATFDRRMFEFPAAAEARDSEESSMQIWGSFSQPAVASHSAEQGHPRNAPASHAGGSCQSQTDTMQSLENSFMQLSDPSSAEERPHPCQSQSLNRSNGDDNIGSSVDMWGFADLPCGSLKTTTSAPSQSFGSRSDNHRDTSQMMDSGRQQSSQSHSMWGATSQQNTSGPVHPREQHSLSQKDEFHLSRTMDTGSAQLVCSDNPNRNQAFVWGCGKEDEAYDESAVRLRCQQEGPPGPAGASLALPGWQADHRHGGTSSHATSLRDSIGWLCALKSLSLQFNSFHLGIACSSPSSDSVLAKHNLAVVSKYHHPQKRWDLVVLVRQVQLVAGEIDVLLADPTGEMEATVDRRVASAWPRAANEGTALLLTGVVAIAASAGICRLLIMEKNVVRIFCPSDVRPDDAESLRMEARTSVSGSS